MKRRIILLTTICIAVLTACGGGGGGSGSGGGSSNPYTPREAKYSLYGSDEVVCHNASRETENSQAVGRYKSCTWYCATNYNRKRVHMSFHSRSGYKGNNKPWVRASVTTSPGQCS